MSAGEFLGKRRGIVYPIVGVGGTTCLPIRQFNRLLFVDFLIAIHGISPGDGQWEKLEKDLNKVCFRHYILTILYAVGAASARKQVTPCLADYGGDIDKKTWERDWAGTC